MLCRPSSQRRVSLAFFQLVLPGCLLLDTWQLGAENFVHLGKFCICGHCQSLFVSVCVCVCAEERERERGRVKRERERREREREREREEIERARARVRACACVRVVRTSVSHLLAHSWLVQVVSASFSWQFAPAYTHSTHIHTAFRCTHTQGADARTHINLQTRIDHTLSGHFACQSCCATHRTPCERKQVSACSLTNAYARTHTHLYDGLLHLGRHFRRRRICSHSRRSDMQGSIIMPLTAEGQFSRLTCICLCGRRCSCGAGRRRFLLDEDDVPGRRRVAVRSSAE